MEECQFVGDASLAYLKKKRNKMERKIHSVSDEKEKKTGLTITADIIQTAIEVEKRRDEEEQKTRYLENFGQMSLLDTYSSDMTGSIRRGVIKELLYVGASEEVIKEIVHLVFAEAQVIQKKKKWMEMKGKM